MIRFTNSFLLHLISFFMVILFINCYSLIENSNIKISIIIPIYNVEKYLSECLELLIYNYSTSSPQIKNDKETAPCCNKSRSFYNSYSFYGSQYC